MILLILLIFGVSYGIDLETAIRKAIDSNPEIRALEERKKTFEGMKMSAGAFPNPNFRFESGFVTTDENGKPAGRALYILEYDQPLPLWNVRDKGVRVIEKELSAFSRRVEFERRRLAGKVYTAFYESLFRKELIRIWEENLKVALQVKEFVKKVHSLGEATPLELLRAEREERMVLMRLRIAQAEYRASLKRLSTLVAEDIEDVEGDLVKVKDIGEVDVDSLPIVESLRNRIEALSRKVEFERALSRPQISAGLVLEDSEEGYYGLRVMVSARLPVFYRRQGEILKVISERKALKEELKAWEIRIRNDLNRLKILYGTLREELERLESSVIPKAKEELELALKSYKLRVITLLELSDVRRRYYELLIRRAELYRDLHRVYGEFISLGGWEP